MKTVVYILIGIVLLGGGAFLVTNKKAEAPEQLPEQHNTLNQDNQNTEETSGVFEDGTISEEDFENLPDMHNEGESASSGTNNNTQTPPPTQNQTAKVFNLEGQNYKFNPSEIRVKKGDVVTINFTSTGGFHDWTVDEFGAATNRVNSGGTSSVTFTATKTGTFEYYCSVGNHRQLGMTGKLIVE